MPRKCSINASSILLFRKSVYSIRIAKNKGCGFCFYLAYSFRFNWVTLFPEAHAEILLPPGHKDISVKMGSPLRLSCLLHNLLEQPSYIFWYRWDRMINYDLSGGAAVRIGHKGSELIIPSAQPSDAGDYTCVPSNARHASVYVNVTIPKSEPATGSMLQHPWWSFPLLHRDVPGCVDLWRSLIVMDYALVRPTAFSLDFPFYQSNVKIEQQVVTS